MQQNSATKWNTVDNLTTIKKPKIEFGTINKLYIPNNFLTKCMQQIYDFIYSTTYYL